MVAVVGPSGSDLLPGVEFGGYVVRERIGSGAMATVYRAEHLMLKKSVALKVMDRSLLTKVGGPERFLREGRAVAAIKHPNVVNITDLGVHDQVPYLVMELLTGQDLQTHLLKRVVLDDSSAVRLALPVIAALSAAHNSGIVHRDVKPSNIFLALGPGGEFTPKVLDFGISRLNFDHTGRELITTPRDHIVGTPHYLAPEALSGQSLGPAADQYSLGVVLYECVTGRTPYSGETLASLFGCLSRGEFERPTQVRPGISPRLERVILRAMSSDPADRFPTLRDMGAALFELAAERTQVVWGNAFRSPGGSLAHTRQQLDGPSSAPSVEQPLERWKRRAPVGLALFLATLLVAVASSLLARRNVERAPALQGPPSTELTTAKRLSSELPLKVESESSPATQPRVALGTRSGEIGAGDAVQKRELATVVARALPAPEGAAGRRQSVRPRHSRKSAAPWVKPPQATRPTARSRGGEAAGPSPAPRASALLPARTSVPVLPAPSARVRPRGANGAPFLD